ncbi:MAG: hypothetical protein J5I52_11470 [Saprospiraceae bacterium]|nr:hypothetical protein [Saprospiraceae bacterium]
MKKFNFVLTVAVFYIALISCSNYITKNDMVGSYIVNLQLNEKKYNKEAIQIQVDSAMNKAKDEFARTKSEMDHKFADIEKIDTTTFEGKMEYMAMSLGKSLSDFGNNLTQMGDGLKNMMTALGGESLDLLKGITDEMTVEVELQADGDIKIKDNLFSFGFNNSKWELKDNKFIVQRNLDNEKPIEFTVSEVNDEGFILSREDFKLIFKRKI